MKTYLILFLAIVFETVATSFLKQSEQFTKLVPSVLTVLGYAAAFYCLSVVLKSIPVGIAYAIWSGVGIILIALIGFFVSTAPRPGCHHRAGPDYCRSGRHQCLLQLGLSLMEVSRHCVLYQTKRKKSCFSSAWFLSFFSIIGRSQIYTFNIRYKYAFSSLLL